MPPDPFQLSRHEIHLWIFEPKTATGSTGRLDQFLGRMESSLSVDEQARANRFHFDRDRRAFVTNRGILRALLGRYLGMSPRNIEIAHSITGKPSLPNDHPIRFNVSHTDSAAVLAFTMEQELGVDIEQIRSIPDMVRLAERFFSPEEGQDFRAIPAEDREKAFFLCWTRKEAFLKAKGTGLLVPLNSFRVTLRPDELARIVRIGNCSGAGEWNLHDLKVVPGCAAALAYAGEPRTLVQRIILGKQNRRTSRSQGRNGKAIPTSEYPFEVATQDFSSCL